jgi:hypothetical protein
MMKKLAILFVATIALAFSTPTTPVYDSPQPACLPCVG